MSNWKLVSVAAGLTGLLAATQMGMRARAQGEPELRVNLTSAAVAEVKDEQGVVVLRGAFAVVDEQDEDIERKAVLKPAGSDADASGEAEVEYPRTGAVVQEVEFSLKNLVPGAKYTCVIDGKTIAIATAGKKGTIGVDLEVKMPAAPSQQ